jgi:hypothetical protein
MKNNALELSMPGVQQIIKNNFVNSDILAIIGKKGDVLATFYSV